MTVKVWTLLFTTLLLVTGCSKSEVVTSYPDQVAKQDYSKQQPTLQEVKNDSVPIVFSIYNGGQATTRAAVSTVDDLGREGFGVFAYYTGTNDYNSTTIPNFMYNQRVNGVFDGETLTGWDYDPLKYWPNNVDAEGHSNQKISFFVYGTHVPMEPQEYYKPDGTLGTRFEVYDSSDPVHGINAYKTRNQSGIVAFSKNDYAGDPFLIYSLDVADGGYVEVGDMNDLIVAEGKTDQTKDNNNLSFSFQHALAAFGFGVSGVFNATARNNALVINPDNYIRIEEIIIKVSLPQKGVYNMGQHQWEDGFTGGSPQPTVFRFDADHIAKNLRYPDYFVYEKKVEDGELKDVVNVEKTTQRVQDLSDDEQLLNFGVGRVYGDELESVGMHSGDPIPNNQQKDDKYYFQKVGLTGEGQQNLFYFIPSGEADVNGDIKLSFDITITYHTLTKDDRMLYGLGDVKNVVNKTVDVTLNPIDPETSSRIEPVGRIYMINMLLGMSDVKINGVSMTDSYLQGNEESTPWDGTIYYTVPK